MRKSLCIFVAIAAIAFATRTIAHETKFKEIVVVHPWVLETEQARADLHVRIKNTGTFVERLLRASTRLASSALLVDANGRGVNEVVIPRGGELTLQPGGAHIVLSGLKKPLRPYDSFDLTLVFEKVGAVRVEVLVEEKTSDAWRGNEGPACTPTCSRSRTTSRVARVSATAGRRAYALRASAESMSNIRQIVAFNHSL
jgi:copper(I)-binding protein